MREAERVAHLLQKKAAIDAKKRRKTYRIALLILVEMEDSGVLYNPESTVDCYTRVLDKHLLTNTLYTSERGNVTEAIIKLLSRLWDKDEQLRHIGLVLFKFLEKNTRDILNQWGHIQRRISKEEAGLRDMAL